MIIGAQYILAALRLPRRPISGMRIARVLAGKFRVALAMSRKLHDGRPIRKLGELDR